MWLHIVEKHLRGDCRTRKHVCRPPFAHPASPATSPVHIRNCTCVLRHLLRPLCTLRRVFLCPGLGGMSVDVHVECPAPPGEAEERKGKGDTP